jgi:hypothetical protein
VNTELLDPRTDAAPLTAAQVRAQVNLIQEVMRAVMKDGMHYGTIPGTTKPTLYKAGAEKILSTFRIAIQPDVLDLSTSDEAHFRVTTNALSQATGAYLGGGVGECSSHEEKYMWREAVCEQEWDSTPEDRRRLKWKGRGDKAYSVKQVRTNAADVANTVLKMAKKRAQIDACLTVTAASDVFAQDIEDLPEEIREAITGETASVPAPMQPPQRKAEPEPARDEPRHGVNHATATGTATLISEPQQKRLYAIAMGKGWSQDGLAEFLRKKNYTHSRDIPKKFYDGIVRELEAGAGA